MVEGRAAVREGSVPKVVEAETAVERTLLGER